LGNEKTKLFGAVPETEQQKLKNRRAGSLADIR
jgi:hypothetical protein